MAYTYVNPNLNFTRHVFQEENSNILALHVLKHFFEVSFIEVYIEKHFITILQHVRKHL
jgi:hypothetical protein